MRSSLVIKIQFKLCHPVKYTHLQSFLKGTFETLNFEIVLPDLGLTNLDLDHK